jgi:hypothetical protein
VEWERICEEIEAFLLKGPQKVGRDISFSTFSVEGWWRGTRSGVQIVPPPDNAPRARELADNPFILEFPIQDAGIWSITNHRRVREHRRITRLLNLLLAGATKSLPERRREFWASDPCNAPTEVKWVQENYFANFGEAVTEVLSPPTGQRLEELEAERYYAEVCHDGRGLCVPHDLDDLICQYQKLRTPLQAKFDRATYWLSMARRHWEDSMSTSYASLVSAAEGLSERRSKMYGLRSKILHGSDLMQLDQGRAFGWDPPWRNEEETNEELWTLMRIAARNWLREPPSERN